jgi:hypothetical protein
MFFVNEVPHPYSREYEGLDCSSYSNRGHNTLYYVSSGPLHGYFRYYASAWAASIQFQGATATTPIEPLQVLIDRWFTFDSTRNVVAPPYPEPDLEVDGDFSRCAWESLYSPITPVQRARSILRLCVWRTGSNNGCPIMWGDPMRVILDTAHSQVQ